MSVEQEPISIFYNHAKSLILGLRHRLPTAILSAAATAIMLWSAPLSEIAPPPAMSDVEAESPETPERLGVELKRGDTLLTLLTRHGIKRPSAHELITKVRPLLNLRKLRQGNQVELTVNPVDRSVQEITVPLEDNIVRATATEQGWTVEREEIPSTEVTRVVRDTISNSLYVNGVAAGLSPEHILGLAQIFEYDIDFFSDFQRGDAFSVVVDEVHYANGRRVPRKILAAQLEADGKLHDAFYFSPGPGRGYYYDSDGKQLRRSFLRAPLSYARISSRYTVARRHPIFRIVRPHQAIDYAAPSGTPVVAIGRGRVSFSGWRAGYGNFVEIVHPGGYASRYGHFSRINGRVRRGTQVNAGDIVGYVGQTGHATGPHLHFEFLQSGRKIDFLNVKIPRTEKLTGKLLEQFKHSRDASLARLTDHGPATTSPPDAS
jgi:murein DD-endopeptidase MepM/ murein hydrolase activator NlpD